MNIKDVRGLNVGETLYFRTKKANNPAQSKINAGAQQPSSEEESVSAGVLSAEEAAPETEACPLCPAILSVGGVP